MRLTVAWMPTFMSLGLLSAVSACSTSQVDLSDAGIRSPIYMPVLEAPPTPPAQLPAPPVSRQEMTETRKEKSQDDTPAQDVSAAPATGEQQAATALQLSEVLESVQQHFPLLLAIEQERAIASGQRLAAEGGFDLNLRGRGVTQGGTFPSNRLDLIAEQPTSYHGLSFFSGYRFGFNDFPVYYGDRLTADGGEFRAGVNVPLLKDGPIDRRRASLRQAQIAESLADPVVQRARIDYVRNAARSFWGWVAAGEQFRVAESLLRLAMDRQAGFEEQFKQGQVSELVVIDNQRLIAERQGTLIAAERRFQQASIELSLYLRDSAGDPVIPVARRLPQGFTVEQPSLPRTEQLREDIETAYSLRPELVRFALLKERAAVDLRLAENQALPAVNVGVGGSQDVGKGKESTGIFALDRSVVEASLLLEVPLQRREATGRACAAQAAMMQLLAQERYARDQIGAEVQDAVSNLDRTYQRLQRAREEQTIARRVAQLELERFRKGQGNLLEVNLRELAAAGAEAKVVEALADYFRAQADHRAALGMDGKLGDRN